MSRVSSIVCVLLVLACLPAAASTFLAMGPDELVAKADAIVVGEVVSVESYWNEKGTLIVTDAVIAVEESLIGDKQGTVVVRTIGGTVGEYTVVASGHPTFEQGERLLVFLTPRKDGTDRVLGYRQGQFRIITGDDGLDVAVSTLTEDPSVQLVNPEDKVQRLPASLPLERLKQMLRQRIELLQAEQITSE